MILFRSFERDRELYQRYDNYDAINVDRIADIPYDYCESWELTESEYSQLNQQEWEIVRHGRLGGEPSVFVVPADGTWLRSMLSEHADGYKQAIENALDQVITPSDACFSDSDSAVATPILPDSRYGSGLLGVPITFISNYSPGQFRIIGLDRYVHNNQNQDTASQSITEKPMPESLSNSKNNSLENNTNQQVNSVLHDRECNGEIGVPITVMNSFPRISSRSLVFVRVTMVVTYFTQ